MMVFALYRESAKVRKRPSFAHLSTNGGLGSVQVSAVGSVARERLRGLRLSRSSLTSVQMALSSPRLLVRPSARCSAASPVVVLAPFVACPIPVSPTPAPCRPPLPCTPTTPKRSRRCSTPASTLPYVCRAPGLALLHTTRSLALTYVARLALTRAQTLLRSAATAGAVRCTELLLAHHANPNHADSRGLTPLHLTCGKSHHLVARVLLAFGADPNHRDAVRCDIDRAASHRSAALPVRACSIVLMRLSSTETTHTAPPRGALGPHTNHSLASGVRR